uniref:Uncharacterized protein n=1 Tax=Globisporangium ultimum (strain ATCC 200006 / CBS 805.95 / DAOM BR144) TaxID=431595 RepID=K3WC13_GLOUD
MKILFALSGLAILQLATGANAKTALMRGANDETEGGIEYVRDYETLDQSVEQLNDEPSTTSDEGGIEYAEEYAPMIQNEPLSEDEQWFQQHPPGWNSNGNSYGNGWIEGAINPDLLKNLEPINKLDATNYWDVPQPIDGPGYAWDEMKPFMTGVNGAGIPPSELWEPAYISAQLDKLPTELTNFPVAAATVEHACYVKFRYSGFSGVPAFEWFARKDTSVSAEAMSSWFARHLSVTKKDATAGRVFKQSVVETLPSLEKFVACMGNQLHSQEERQSLDRSKYYGLVDESMTCLNRD